MRIDEIIDADLEKTINEIVKLGDRDESVVAGEIGEYVVTPDIERHFLAVLRRLEHGIVERKESNVGFWVSGFYGSGKSSFIKVLSYALENPRLAGREARELLLERTTGSKDLRDRLTKVSATTPVVIRFDLQGDRDLTSFDNEPFTAIAYRALRRTLGYAESLRIAELEIRLEDENRLDDFVVRYEATFGKGAWSRQKHKEEPGLDNASRILHELDPKTYPSADSWAQTDRAIVLTAGNFPERAAKLVDRRRGEGRPFIIVADEVGHYISRSSDRMQDVQGIVESLGRDLKGRAWLFVTAQERLDAVWTATGKQLSELPKIQDRYAFVDLAPKDIGEVTQRRLLRKNDAGLRELGSKFAKSKDALRTHTELRGAAHFVTNPDLVSLSEANFVAYYPFLPYQVDLMLRIVSGIRDRGGAHRLTGGAARTLIRLVQDILTQHPDIRLADKDVGRLATIDLVYDQQVPNLPSERRTDLDSVVAVFKSDPLAIQIAKALCVLEYADQRAGVGGAGSGAETARAMVPRTLENLAAVLHPRIDAEPLTDDIRSALGRLEEKGKVRRTPAGYELLTPAAQRWEEERSRLRIGRDDRLAEIRATAKQMLEDVSSWRHKRGRKFAIDWNLDGRSLMSGSKDIRIEVRRPEEGQTFDAVRAAAEAHTRQDRLIAEWIFADWDALEDAAAELCASDRMVQRYKDQAGTAYDKLLRDEHARVDEKRRELRQHMQSAILSGSLVFDGVPHPVSEFGTSLEESVRKAIEFLQGALFTEYELASLSADDRLIKTVLDTPRIDALPEVLRGGNDGIALLVQEAGRWEVDANGRIANHVLAALGGQGKRGPELEQHFRKPPFGWTEDTLRLVLATMLRGGLLKVTHRGRTLTTASEVGATEPFLGRAAFAAAAFARRGGGTGNKERVAAARALGRARGEAVDPDEGAIHRAVNELAAREHDGLVALEARLRALGLPGADRVGETLAALRGIATGTAADATDTLATSGEDLADSIDWVRRLQRSTSDESITRIRDARDAVDRLAPALEKDEAEPSLRAAAEKLRGWLGGEAVFQHLTDLPALTATIVRAYDARAEALTKKRSEAYRQAVEHVRAMPSFDTLSRQSPERAAAILAPLEQLAAPAGAAGIPQLQAELAASGSYAREALTQVELAVAPAEKPPERVAVAKYLAGAVGDDAELSDRIEKLREACVLALKRAGRIILE